jgi:G:T/U-mismatch repair DNA glycosylase
MKVSKSGEVPPRTGEDPYVANFFFRSMRGKWRERYAGICGECFDNAAVCGHFPEVPLRCLLIGHNPSEHAFQSGYFYSNPTNRMLLLLTGRYGSDATMHFDGLAPAGAPLSFQNRIALERGVGLTDLGVEPGNDAGSYSAELLRTWRSDLYRSLTGHVRRVGDTLAHLRDVALGKTVHTSGSGLVVESSSSAASAGTTGILPAEHARDLLSAFDSLASWSPADSTSSLGGGAGGKPAAVSVASAGSSWSAAAAGAGISPRAKRRRLACVGDVIGVESAAAAATNSGHGDAGLGAPASAPVTLLRSEARCRDPSVCAPRVVAFTGKNQWKMLFDPPLKVCEHGLQPSTLRPPAWPLPASTAVWILSSSSGRAAMTDEARRAPYRGLAQLVATMPWLRKDQQAAVVAAAPACRLKAVGAAGVGCDSGTLSATSSACK